MFFSDFSDEIKIYKLNYASKELLLELQKENIDFALISDYQTREQIKINLLVYKEPMILVLPNNHKCS